VDIFLDQRLELWDEFAWVPLHQQGNPDGCVVQKLTKIGNYAFFEQAKWHRADTASVGILDTKILHILSHMSPTSVTRLE
jgi:hypothetical protein